MLLFGHSVFFIFRFVTKGIWCPKAFEEQGLIDKLLETLREMSADELWTLNQEVVVLVGRKLEQERARLEECLRKIDPSISRARRPYPKVVPKYRNPKNPGETWSGRGKQPRWLVAQLRSGARLDYFLIRRSA